LAAQGGAAEIGLEHLSEGLRMVEKYYVFHSTFDRLFSRYPLLRGAMERMFEHPLYPFVMCRGEGLAEAAE
jgi:hypothetical protein